MASGHVKVGESVIEEAFRRVKTCESNLEEAFGRLTT